jgi:putative MATE family efflux protein
MMILLKECINGAKVFMDSPKTTRLSRDWTQGNIVGNLLSLSWPMLITRALMSLAPTVDMIVVGKLGAASVAGVGIGGIAMGLVESLKQGLTMGVRAMVARFVGEGDNEKAIHVAQQGYIITAIFTAFLSTIGFFLAESILKLIGASPDVIEQGAPYIRIQFVVSVFMTCRMTTDAVMEASGDTVTPMKITILYRLFHVALVPFMVYGWWIFPKLGTSGAAWTGVASQSIAMTLGLWVLLSGRSRLRLTFRNFRPDPTLIWRLVKISIPASVNGMEMSLAQFLVVSFITPFGTVAVAAHALTERVNQFIYMPVMALGIGAGVLSGQNLGAKQPGHAQRAAWISIGLGTAFVAVTAIGIWFGAELIVPIFNSQPEVVSTTAQFMRIALVSVLLLGPAVMLPQILNGVGDTMPPMIVTLAAMWGVQVPLAYFLPKVTALGVIGVRWALVGGSVLRAISFTSYFLTGRWKRKRV